MGTVQYIARLTCACGKTVDLPTEIDMEVGCSPMGGAQCVAKLGFPTWTSGFRGDGSAGMPIECDACGDARLDLKYAKQA